MSDEECIYPGCELTEGKALGYCNAHYLRFTRGRDMAPPIRKWKATDAERFWPKVEKTPTCWNWKGADSFGYGVFRINGANRLAHRVSYMWASGPIPEGAEVDHMCFNHACVRPDHLRLLTHTQNGQNRATANSNSRSGVRGVYWNEPGQVWIAKGMLNRVAHNIGRFAELEDAKKAASEWRREHMPASINDQRKAA